MYIYIGSICSSGGLQSNSIFISITDLTRSKNPYMNYDSIPMTAGKESILYKNEVVFIHVFVLCPIT